MGSPIGDQIARRARAPYPAPRSGAHSGSFKEHLDGAKVRRRSRQAAHKALSARELSTGSVSGKLTLNVS